MSNTAPDGRKKGSRVWTDGCYDMIHYGHANQLRQAKLFGKKLIVGVHNDEEIEANKGPTIFTEDERYYLVDSIKWVDEVVEDAPFLTISATLNQLDCDFCVHSDDISLSADGYDTYDDVKKCGRYRECKTTDSINSTEIVGRLLLLTKTHHVRGLEMIAWKDEASSLAMDNLGLNPFTKVSVYNPTTKTIQQIIDGQNKIPKKIVYVNGAFDLFHSGHLEFLNASRELGDYLVVGINDDTSVNQRKGANYPIMNLKERVLTVLSYKPVDHVLIGAPIKTDSALLDALKIDIVANGIIQKKAPLIDESDPFEEPKKRGIYVEIDSGNDITTETIVNRILQNRFDYDFKNRNKNITEIRYYEGICAKTDNNHV